jgi:hypothetical protein
MLLIVGSTGIPMKKLFNIMAGKEIKPEEVKIPS